LADIPKLIKICNTHTLDYSILLPLLGASLVFVIAAVFCFERRVP
jgi:hypothetical protein